MPDTRQHRGAHPSDIKLFDASKLSLLRTATSELSWLLSRGYAITSALKLVGDRHGLNKRQRLALSRAIKASKPSRTRAVFSLMPVSCDAFSKIWSSMFNVVLICINMHKTCIIVNRENISSTVGLHVQNANNPLAVSNTFKSIGLN